MENKDLGEISNSDALRMLRNQWPEIFKISEPKPLKIGIHKDIIALDIFEEIIINKALKFYTSQENYLLKIKPGKIRIDLNGLPVGKVKVKEAVNSEIVLYNSSREKKRVYVGQLKLISSDLKNKIDS